MSSGMIPFVWAKSNSLGLMANRIDMVMLPSALDTGALYNCRSGGRTVMVWIVAQGFWVSYYL